MFEPAFAVYGTPPHELAEVPSGARQVSPLIPGSDRIEDYADASLGGIAMLAPPGTFERRYALAQALRVLRPGGLLTAVAQKDKGGARLGRELRTFGCPAAEIGRRHHRICTLTRPATALPLATSLEEGGPRHIENLALCTQPGVFSWERIDPGTALLLANLQPLAGRGADLGCGLGILSRHLLDRGNVTSLILVDIDRRAVEMARRNVSDPRVDVLWADLCTPMARLAQLDFVVTNPPFHDGGVEDQALGRTFISRAAQMLRPSGILWLVANAHLPYEAQLQKAFRSVSLRASANGYKVYEARK